MQNINPRDSVALLVLGGINDRARDVRELGKRCVATKRHRRYLRDHVRLIATLEREHQTVHSGRACKWSEAELAALYLFGYGSK